VQIIRAKLRLIKRDQIKKLRRKESETKKLQKVKDLMLRLEEEEVSIKVVEYPAKTLFLRC
jgi:hypothetical protein